MMKKGVTLEILAPWGRETRWFASRTEAVRFALAEQQSSDEANVRFALIGREFGTGRLVREPVRF